MIATLAAQVKDGARRAGLTLAAFLCLAVGAGFLAAAAWVMLDRAFGPVVASGTIGGTMVLIAGILLAMAAHRPARRAGPQAAAVAPPAVAMPETVEEALSAWLTAAGLPPPPAGTSGAVVAAFLTGVTMAMASRGGTHP